MAGVFPQDFQQAQRLGVSYYRIYEPALLGGSGGLTAWPFNIGTDIPVVPWGLVVGPDSEIDRFDYLDYVGYSPVFYGFGVGSPLLNIVPTGFDNSNRFILPARSFPNTVHPLVDLYVFFKPTLNLPAPKRASLKLFALSEYIPFGGGVWSQTGGPYATAFGRRALSLAFSVSSGSVVRLDLFSTIWDSLGTNPVDTPFFSFTSAGVPNDGCFAEIPLPTDAGSISFTLTGISGSAGYCLLRGDLID